MKRCQSSGEEEAIAKGNKSLPDMLSYETSGEGEGEAIARGNKKFT